MTKPLLAILLLLPLSVSAGELDGKAIYCRWLGSDSEAPFTTAASDDVGFYFSNGRQTTYYIAVSGTKAFVFPVPAVMADHEYEYEVTPRLVTWQQLTGDDFKPLVMFKLDRATLLLSYQLTGGDEALGWECEVYTSHDDFQLFMYSRRLRKQAEIDEQMSNNKI